MRLLISARSRPGHPSPDLPLSRREIGALMGRMVDALKLSGASLTLTLIDDHGIALLNSRFLGCEGPTNILSFPSEDPGRPGDLGELYLSTETFERECFLYGQRPVEHLARLLAHGLLHLAGFDHGPEMEARTEQAVAAALAGVSAAEGPAPAPDR